MTPEARAFAGDGIRLRSKPTRTPETVEAAQVGAPVESGAPEIEPAESRAPGSGPEPPPEVEPESVEPGPTLAADVSAPDEPLTDELPAHSVHRGPHVVIVGGGGTGAALAHDLVLRGLRVTLVERGEITSGSTGRAMGLLHSGARYATSDRVAASDCVAENKILRRIAPGSFEENDGLIVALTEEEADFRKQFLEACWQAAVPTRQIPRNRVLGIEPGLDPSVRLALQVADATMDPMRLVPRFLATARANGGEIRTFTEVVKLSMAGRSVEGVRIRAHATGLDEEISADLVVNAAGAWAGKLAAMADVTLPMTLEAGTMIAVRGRHSNMVVSRLREPGNSDLLVPMRQQTVFGVAWRDIDDADDAASPEGALEKLVGEAAQILPAVHEATVRATWSSIRPVFADDAGRLEGMSGEIRCFDHALDPVPTEGFVTVAGGNSTLMRHIAEAAADVVCRKLGFDCRCETAATPLLPHPAWYAR